MTYLLICPSCHGSCIQAKPVAALDASQPGHLTTALSTQRCRHCQGRGRLLPNGLVLPPESPEDTGGPEIS